MVYNFEMAPLEDPDNKNQLNLVQLLVQNNKSNMDLPEFDRKVPHSFFALFDIFMKINNITDAETQLSCMIRKIPSDIILVLEETLSDDTITEEERLDRVKQNVLKHLHRDADEMLDYYLTFQKRPDQNFSSFLRALKSIAKACNKESDKELLKHRFMHNIKDEMRVGIARTMLLKEELDVIAKALDNLPERKEVYAVNLQDSKIDKLALLLENLSARFDTFSKEARKHNETREPNRSNDYGHRQNRSDNNRYAPHKHTGNREQPHDFRYNDKTNYGQNHKAYNGYTNPPRRDNNNVCYYHDRFGAYARKCDPLCKFFRKN